MVWAYFLLRFILAAEKDTALMGFDLSKAAGSQDGGQPNYPMTRVHRFLFFLYVPVNTP